MPDCEGYLVRRYVITAGGGVVVQRVVEADVGTGGGGHKAYVHVPGCRAGDDEGILFTAGEVVLLGAEVLDDARV